MKNIISILMMVLMFSAVSAEEDYDSDYWEPMPGPQGDPGPRGFPGTNGTNGIDGHDGATGPRGYPGTDANINPNDYQAGTALGLAMSAHQFDFDTTDTQVSAATGYYEGPSAISVGAAKRMGRLLFSGSVGTTTRRGQGASFAVGTRF